MRFYFNTPPQAIKIAALAIMRMRPETIARAHFDLLHSTLDPLITTAPQRLQVQESQNIAEDRLSLLYTDLIPPGMLVKPVATQSLAQRLKNMSHVNLGGVSVARQSSNDTGDGDSDCESNSDRASGSGRGSMGGRSNSVGRAPSSGEYSIVVVLLSLTILLITPSCPSVVLIFTFITTSHHYTRTDKRGGGDLVDDIIGVLNTHDEEDAAYLQVRVGSSVVCSVVLYCE